MGESAVKLTHTLMVHSLIESTLFKKSDLHYAQSNSANFTFFSSSLTAFLA